MASNKKLPKPKRALHKPIKNKEHHYHHHFSKVKKLEAGLVVLGTFIILLGSSLVWLLARDKYASDIAAIIAAQEKVSVSEAKESLINVRSEFGFEVTYDKNLYGGIGYYSGSGTLEPVGRDEQLKTLNKSNVVVMQFLRSEKHLIGHEITVNTPTSKNALNDIKSANTNKAEVIDDSEAVARHFSPKTTDNTEYTLLKKEKVTINGLKYTKFEFSVKNKKALALSVSDKHFVYGTVQNNRPYGVSVTSIREDEILELPQMQKVLDTLNYFVPSSTDLALKPNEGGVVLGTTETIDPSVKIISAVTPGVVRIATLYCTDFSLTNLARGLVVPMGRALCAGGYGSGFMLSSDGYIGTNGHVVTFSPADALINTIASGDKKVIFKFLKFLLPDESDATINELVEQSLIDGNLLNAIIVQVYLLPKGSFKVDDERSKYAVQLGREPLKLKYDTTESGSNLFYTNSVLEAKLIDKDYNPDDLISVALNGNFTASDVALIKVEGKNFPITEMGTIKTLLVGAEIFVVGFPGPADLSNPLVDLEKSPATATRGIVSAIRESKGYKRKLIQSDVSIDHGNSGGPAFNSSGKVVGLATYGITAGGTFNYMRDIQDLKDVINKNNIKLNTSSETQQNWDKGLDLFWRAHYTKSLTYFNKVKSLYPAHALVQDFIELANQKIKDGEEAKDYTVYYYSLAGVLLLTVIIFVVVKVSHGKHKEALATLDKPVKFANK